MQSPGKLAAAYPAALRQVKAIGLSYQMLGLVLVDDALRVLRPAILWCDSRAADIGRQAFEALGEDVCMQHLLNSPGNFTASKLKWVKGNEPDIFARVYKAMLPGDYVALRMTGEAVTTPAGLSEGILWDFQTDGAAEILLAHYGIPPAYLPSVVEVIVGAGKSCDPTPRRNWDCLPASRWPIAAAINRTTRYPSTCWSRARWRQRRERRGSSMP